MGSTRRFGCARMSAADKLLSSAAGGDEDEFRNKLLASLKPTSPSPEKKEDSHHQEERCDDDAMQETDMEQTKQQETEAEREERLFNECKECPFLQGWPASQQYPRMGNGDQFPLSSSLLNHPPLFFHGTVRSQYPGSAGLYPKKDTPVPYAQVTLWVSNDEGDHLGGTFACDSAGDFWFQSVAPSAYTVLRRSDETEELESSQNPAHISFECSHSHFKQEVMHLFVTKHHPRRASTVQLREVNNPAEAARRGCQNPFIDVHCDVLLSLEPRENEDLCLAEEIMLAADGHCQNEFLSVTELGTFLMGTTHEHFAKWLLYSRGRNFKKFDKNKDGGISKKELARAISMYRDTHEADNHRYNY